MRTEIRCQCNDDWDPTKGGKLAGWVEGEKLYRAAAKVQRTTPDKTRERLDARGGRLSGHGHIWCPACGRVFWVSETEQPGGGWHKLDNVWVSLTELRERTFHIRV